MSCLPSCLPSQPPACLPPLTRAQVYRATLVPALGGGEVAVKVQRPGVLDAVALDLHIMRELALYVGALPEVGVGGAGVGVGWGRGRGLGAARAGWGLAAAGGGWW